MVMKFMRIIFGVAFCIALQMPVHAQKIDSSFTVLNNLPQPLEKMVIIFLDPEKNSQNEKIISRWGLWDDGAMKIIGDQIATIISNSGLETKYVGHFPNKAAYANLLYASGDRYKLVYLPTALSLGSSTQMHYLVILYSPDSNATPIFQSESDLTQHKMATMNNMSARLLVKKLIDAKIYSPEGKQITPTKMEHDYPPELTSRY
ncbi:hypothetical protein [Herbaspirillum sp.]|uniref:hypothetical protein n=1 Tax=Herbaspirillum sp. TaxID=1890675 RepID=UPI0031E3CA7D